MGIKNHQIVLIIGACDKKNRLNSYVLNTNNGINFQIIDVTKNINELPTCDQSYLDYINQTVTFFIGDAIEKVDAVIFYGKETQFNNAFIQKLNPQCMVINFLEAKMNEREIIEYIGVNNNQLNMKSKDDPDNNLVFMKIAHDLQLLTNSQKLSQGFAGFFVKKKIEVISDAENIFDIRWPV